MKLLIQIPCYNEASTLAITLADLPREIAGVEKVEWLIINDGCTDNTVEVAIANGVDHVVSFPRNRGLAKAFLAGIDASLKLGADVIVNTDADNQYCAADIQKLVDPILAGKAEIVIGARPISEIEHFSPIKKVLQKFGSWIVRITSNTNIPDAPSGFRAISRNAAMQLHVFNQYTYTLETIIQAGLKGMVTTSVPIRTNADLRPSRLVKSIYSYVRRSVFTILRIFMTYKPLRCFAIPGALCFSLGLAIGLRFMYFYISGDGSGHIQSLILGALLLGSGFFLGITGLLADLISVNRKLLEDIDYRLKKIELSKPE
ncbi:glycosyltransferase family 2 protein [Geomonas ferrireducens]|uniref:glycosyltransferase family 2 protein n=1 Tax=Geomonas ferrireducens TaxID=2570227 RepID=UPI0010A890A3|nr:glycosyltransferase family 2 protein [Geomonas ferrireducens]